ncbi:MAG TPA: OmpH family outer membrane protein [Candidatus Polarisedimenticolia bacterium]|nr:OmpH family outer membrane protein [Candidatus Polarisedimenticolia bacterium]
MIDVIRVTMGMAAALALVPGTAPAQSPAAPQARIAVVNQDRVLNDSEEGKRLKADLEKLRSSKQSSIEAKEKEIKALQDQALNAQLSLSEEKREEIARQIKRKRVEYERLNDDATAEFQEAANRAQARLIGIFRDVIGKYGAEKGYTLILEKGTVYFAHQTVDVTDELLQRFNEMTRASGAAQAAPPKG